jgi:hypothetical protein
MQWMVRDLIVRFVAMDLGIAGSSPKLRSLPKVLSATPATNELGGRTGGANPR